MRLGICLAATLMASATAPAFAAGTIYKCKGAFTLNQLEIEV